MKAGNEWGCSPGGKTAVDKQSLDVFEGVLPCFTMVYLSISQASGFGEIAPTN